MDNIVEANIMNDKVMPDDGSGLFPDDSMETFSGTHFNILKPDPKMISMFDISHHLSLICRFNGACRWFYSVAQHSIYVADLVKQNGADIVTELGGLLHDAAEAYTGDIIRPIKHAEGVDKLIHIGDVIQEVINKKYGIESANWELVRQADNTLVVTEADQLLPSQGRGWQNLPAPLNPGIVTIHWEYEGIVQAQFHARYYKLSRMLGIKED
jgi:hypothetical protein